MTPETDPGSSKRELQKPKLSYVIATSLGLGYLRPGPGTWGSLAGLALAAFFAIRNDWTLVRRWRVSSEMAGQLLFMLISLAGVWAAGRVAKHCGKTDPQFVVVDEVSGQWMTLLLGSVHAIWNHVSGAGLSYFGVRLIGAVPLNWKYFLLGFILFRGFDIWKPFPVRQAESLPGGWGIMADDWLAAIYAAAGLWIARWLGL